MKTETLQDLYLKELRDLYGSEKLLVKSLPKLMENTELPKLRKALGHHLEEAHGQVTRLEEIFQSHGEQPGIKKPRILEGILREAEDDLSETPEPSLRDAVVVATLQQIKHFEIAAYGTLQSYAVHLGYADTGRLLQTTLEEERAAERTFANVALNHLRVEAMHST
jgi:ferritin-like metal-binding protein YciE